MISGKWLMAAVLLFFASFVFYEKSMAEKNKFGIIGDTSKRVVDPKYLKGSSTRTKGPCSFGSFSSNFAGKEYYNIECSKYSGCYSCFEKCVEYRDAIRQEDNWAYTVCKESWDKSSCR